MNQAGGELCPIVGEIVRAISPPLFRGYNASLPSLDSALEVTMFRRSSFHSLTQSKFLLSCCDNVDAISGAASGCQSKECSAPSTMREKELTETNLLHLPGSTFAPAVFQVLKPKGKVPLELAARPLIDEHDAPRDGMIAQAGPPPDSSIVGLGNTRASEMLILGNLLKTGVLHKLAMLAREKTLFLRSFLWWTCNHCGLKLCQTHII